jgi:very-short-patch-repair endonuclease
VRVSHAMRIGAKPETAKRLRRNETWAEKRLWVQLRNRQLKNFKFVRQAPLGPYIVDFLCREQNLIVEVDGATHSTETEISEDLRRASQLQALGYKIVRFQNDEVINGMDEL